MIERWYDYVAAFASGVAAAQNDVQIPTDGDALYGLRTVIPWPGDLGLRWRNLAIGQDMQSAIIRKYAQRTEGATGIATGGAAGMLPLWPEVSIPINSVISFDVAPGDSVVTPSYVLFRGVKYFDGVPYQAPEGARRRWWSQILPFVAPAAGVFRQQRIWPGYDFDLIVRALTYRYSAAPDANNVQVQLFDQDMYPFQSLPCEINLVFAPANGSGSGRPGLVNGELVIPAGREIYLDVYTDGAASIDFCFQGERVDRR